MEYPWSTKWNADGWGRFDGVQGQQLKIEGERRFSKNLVKMLSVATALTVLIMQFHRKKISIRKLYHEFFCEVELDNLNFFVLIAEKSVSTVSQLVS